MKTEKKTKSQRIAELERKLYESNSYHIYRHHFASKALDKLSTDRLLGSGIILSLGYTQGTSNEYATSLQPRSIPPR